MKQTLLVLIFCIIFPCTESLQFAFFTTLPFIFISVCWGKTYKYSGNRKRDIPKQQGRNVFLKHWVFYHQSTHNG